MILGGLNEESQIRRDYRTGRLCIIAPKRSRRPIELQETDISSIDLSKCPFERGNETLTSEIARYGNPWEIRVIANKFPELSGTTPFMSSKTAKDLINYRGGYGYNEVILLSPNHSDLIEELPLDKLVSWLNVLIERSEILYSRKWIRYVQIFYNYGAAGGASLSHPHGQIIAWPLIAGTVRREIKLAGRYKAKNGSCMYEDIFDTEKGRLLTENKNFFAIAPFGSRITAESMVVPKRHIDCVDNLTLEEKNDFMSILKTVLRTNKGLYDRHAFNFTIHEVKDNPDSHMHLEIYPRMTALAGIELGQDIFVNAISPEEYSEAFRAYPITNN